MAGTRLLQGAHLQKTLNTLHLVADILEDHGIRYWLDAGTLLGIIRENRLLPWDTDIDLAMKAEQADALTACLPQMRKAGLRVTVRHHPVDDTPLRMGTPRIIKVRNRRWHFFRGDVLLDLFIMYKQEDRYFWSVGKPPGMIRMAAPSRFYDTLGECRFEGRLFPIPDDVEKYLEYRYGNWRVPVKTWNTFVDDRAKLPRIHLADV